MKRRPAANCVIRVPSKDSYSTAGPTLMGRQSANEGFLTSWFRHSGHREFWCLARFKSEAEVFARIGEETLGRGAAAPVYRWIAQAQIHRVTPIGTAYLPGPQVADMAWVRRRDARCRAIDFSIVGMTHTTCEMPIQDSLAEMLTAPVYRWDAQICPSDSVRTMVARLLDDEERWLRNRLGATRVERPQLPVLPLGVDLERICLPASERAQLRSQWRGRWALAPTDICLLYVGRLDLRTKADLFPLFDALELAAVRLREQGGPKLLLVLAGWFASDADEKTLREAAREVCPSARVQFEDGRLAEVRRAVWHAADIFASLVDNVQETFGLTPIEAMAAGLPAVVTDYDGYRESVRDGEDGYCIPTSHPPAGTAAELMDLHADLVIGYGDYVSRASTMVGVDVAAAAEAFVRLAQDSSLRRAMGAVGERRARETYSWKVLIPKYQALFDSLAKLRAEGRSEDDWSGPAESASWGARHPRRSDPFHSFSHYPSATMGPDTRVLPGPLLPDSAGGRREALLRHVERPVYHHLKPALPTDLLLDVLEHSAAAPDGVLLGRWLGSGRDDKPLLAHVGWLTKTGLLRVASPVIGPTAREAHAPEPESLNRRAGAAQDGAAGDAGSSAEGGRPQSRPPE